MTYYYINRAEEKRRYRKLYIALIKREKENIESKRAIENYIFDSFKNSFKSGEAERLNKIFHKVFILKNTELSYREKRLLYKFNLILKKKFLSQMESTKDVTAKDLMHIFTHKHQNSNELITTSKGFSSNLSVLSTIRNVAFVVLPIGLLVTGIATALNPIVGAIAAVVWVALVISVIFDKVKTQHGYYNNNYKTLIKLFHHDTEKDEYQIKFDFYGNDRVAGSNYILKLIQKVDEVLKDGKIPIKDSDIKIIASKIIKDAYDNICTEKDLKDKPDVKQILKENLDSNEATHYMHNLIKDIINNNQESKGINWQNLKICNMGVKKASAIEDLSSKKSKVNLAELKRASL